MVVPVLVVICLVLLFALAAAVYEYQTQRSMVVSVWHLVANLAQRNYARRVGAAGNGPAGELARSVNKLAEELEGRAAKAEQDKDHLVSLLALLDHTNEMAIATDNMDMIRLANPAAARVLERPADALLGKHIDTVVHHPDLRALYRQAFSSNGPVSAQIALQMPGRTLHCQATAATIYSGAHYRGTLLVLRDVTEIARALQMKTDFATNASHELRTPLASIRAAVETIKENGTEDEEMTRRCVEIINSHVMRLQLMVQDLLDLSRVEDSRALVRSDRIDLQVLCDAMAGTHAAQLAEKKLQLRIELGEGARVMRGDERLVTLVLKNLLDNAIKFTQQGGVIVRTYLLTGQWSVVSGQMGTETSEHGEGHNGDGSRFILEVRDTGIGVPAEDQERVFERFYTVNRSRGGADRGTGLGLSIVKHAVNAMHGTVSLVSPAEEGGKGTVVRCVFPVEALN